MIRIREILLPKQILLSVKATTREEAITMVSDSLKGDNRIIDWPGFTHCLRECERSGKVNIGLGLTIPHGRTDSVTSMGAASLARRFTKEVLAPFSKSRLTR